MVSSCTACIRCLYIGINTFLAIIGIMLMTTGIFILLFANTIINCFAHDPLKSISDLTHRGKDAVTIDMGLLINPISITLIVIGVVIAGLAIFGIIGLVLANRLLLAAYLTIVLVLIFVQIILAALLFTQKLDPMIRTSLKKSLQEKYVDADNFDEFSLLWTYIMFDFKCCGVNDYTDFEDAVMWNNTRSFQYGGYSFNYTLITPVACCKLAGEFPSAKLKDKFCASRPTDDISNWKTSCWDEVTYFLSRYKVYAHFTVAGLIVIQALIALVTLRVICRAYDDDDKE